MAQQAAPAVGTVMDGYRFKGGDPSQESSWEQVEPIDVSAQYGAGARQLPNGVIERVGPRGGVTRIGSANGGAQGGASALVGADARARFMINLGPLQEAQANLERMEGSGYTLDDDLVAAGLEAIPFDGGFVARKMGGQDYNAYTQAAKTFEAAILPIMSGAAVTPTEAQRLIRAALPQPGDSPTVLAQKAEQRRQMINAVAQGIGAPPPYEVGEGAQPAGLPGASRDAAVNYRDPNNREALAILAAQGGWVRDGGGEPYYVEPGSIRFEQPREGDEEAAAGVFVRPQDGGGSGGGIADLILGRDARDAAAAERSAQGEGLGRKVDAGVRGAADTLTFGLADEIVAGLNTVLPLDAGSQSIWTTSAGDAFRHNLAMQRGIDQADAHDVPVSRATGQVAGALAGGAAAARVAPGLARAVAPAAGGSRLANAGRAAAVGGAYGGAYGFGSGEGNPLQRTDEALIGGGIGAVAGPVAQPVGNALGRYVAEPLVRGGQALARTAARPVVNALGDRAPRELVERVQPNPLASGVARFADRMGERRVNALAPALADRRAAGLDPDLIDVLDDGALGRVRALATRDTPARDLAVRTAEGRRANLPSRVSRIAREEISSDTRPALQAIDDLKAARRQNASAIDGFGADEVPLTPEAVSALRSDFVRPHIQAAARRAQGSGDADAANRLNRLASEVLDNPAAARLTVREAQDVSKALNDAATAAFRTNPADGQVLAELARTVRQTARDNSTGYAAWLRQYGDDSDLIEAATTGRNFVSVSPDPASARGTEAFVQRAVQAGPAEMSIQRAAAREAVETAGSNPTGARTVLSGFASDVDQARRAQAIGADPARLQTRAQAELDSLTRHQRASPRVGSETSTNAQDSMGAAGIGAVRDVASGNVLGLAGRAMNAIRSRGFSDQEAEAIVTAALDPRQADRIVEMLAQRMTWREARNLVRAIRYQVTVGSQQGSGQ